MSDAKPPFRTLEDVLSERFGVIVDEYRQISQPRRWAEEEAQQQRRKWRLDHD